MVCARTNLFLATWPAAVANKDNGYLMQARSNIYDMCLDEVDQSAISPEEPASYGMATILTAQQAARCFGCVTTLTMQLGPGALTTWTVGHALHESGAAAWSWFGSLLQASGAP